jgi:hypothetical protein
MYNIPYADNQVNNKTADGLTLLWLANSYTNKQKKGLIHHEQSGATGWFNHRTSG